MTFSTAKPVFHFSMAMGSSRLPRIGAACIHSAADNLRRDLRTVSRTCSLVCSGWTGYSLRHGHAHECRCLAPR